MIQKKLIVFFLFIFACSFYFFNFVFAQSFFDSYSSTFGNSFNPQYYPPGYGSQYGYSSQLSQFFTPTNYQCVTGQDIILQIAPEGCRPALVRSDLLEEQNVPVFCKVVGLQVNPLIDISRVRSIRVTSAYPKGVSSISYYPPRVAVGGKTVFTNSIYDDNLGYVVVVLSRQANEAAMPDFIEGNITAVVDYVSEAQFGSGDPLLYLHEVTDLEWESNYRDYGFWNGKGYVRVENIGTDSATVSLYRDFNTKQTSVTLREGQISNDIFLSGFYCAAGLRIQLEKIQAPVDSALYKLMECRPG
ncbi:MAG: hypothetical protein AABX16_00580 [Nanoarchaeota archaeon]